MLVANEQAHQYLDATVDGVRHLWMPSSAFILPDDMRTRIGEKLVGIGLLDVDQDTARYDLWCPDGMKRHEVSALDFFNAVADSVPAAQPSAQASTD